VKEWTNEDLKEFADLFQRAVDETSEAWQKAMEIIKESEIGETGKRVSS